MHCIQLLFFMSCYYVINRSNSGKSVCNEHFLKTERKSLLEVSCSSSIWNSFVLLVGYRLLMLRTLGKRSFAPQSRAVFRRYLSGGKVEELTALKQFNQYIGTNDKISVIDFYATWCGPCKMLEPIFATLADKIPEVQFGRVDVDNAQDVAMEYRVTAMPTCIFFKNGEKLDTIVGVNPPKLLELIQKHGEVDLSGR